MDDGCDVSVCDRFVLNQHLRRSETLLNSPLNSELRSRINFLDGPMSPTHDVSTCTWTKKDRCFSVYGDPKGS